LLIVVFALFHFFLQDFDHIFLDLHEPRLNFLLGSNGFLKLYFFALGTYHSIYTARPQIWDVQLIYVVEALFDVFVYRLQVLGLCKNLQQFVVGEEVESGKGHSLFFQIVLQRFLNADQSVFVLLKIFPVLHHLFGNRLIRVGFLHGRFKEYVHLFKLAAFLR